MSRRCMKPRIIFKAILLLSMHHVLSESLARFEFTGSPTADGQFNEATESAEHVTVGPFLRENVVFEPVDDVFASGDWTGSSLPDFSEYVSFSIAAEPGFTLTLDRLVLIAYRSARGPWSVWIDAHVDYLDGSSEIVTLHRGLSISQDPRPFLSFSSIDFADIAGVNSAEIRFHGYLVTAEGPDILHLNTVDMMGLVQAVPSIGLQIKRGMDGEIQLLLRGNPSQPYQLETTFDFVTWAVFESGSFPPDGVRQVKVMPEDNIAQYFVLRP